ncbi:MAG: hypothetical protein KBT68_08325, partial [bacterium]|nr:hypothetical protein [Candidatus Colisoma equi]
MKTSTRNVFAAVLTTAMTSAALCATVVKEPSAGTVFDDSRFWFYGGTDIDSSGVFKTGDFTDVFHAGNPTHALNQQTVSGRMTVGDPQTPTTTLKEIVLPMTGEAKTLRVVNLPQYARPNGGNTDYALWPNACDFSVAGASLCTTDNYTLVWRFKRHGLSHGKAKSYILKGTNYDPQRGFDLMLDSDGKLITSSRHRGDSWKAWGDVAIPDEEWVDLAVVMNGTDFNGAFSTLYLKTSSGEFTKYYTGEKFWGNMCLATTAQNNRSLLLFHNIRNDSERWLSASSGWGLEWGLPAEFQQFAVWDRCLTEAEVREAFGQTYGHVQGTGRFDGSADDLGGGKVTAYTVGDAGDWSGAPSVIAANSQIAYTFTLAKDDPSYAFIVGTAADAPTGDFTVFVNGTEVATKRIVGGGCAVFVAKSKYYLEGENVITLRRNDSGADIALDAVRVVSTWSLGVRDNSFNEFGDIGAVGGACDVRTVTDLKEVRQGIRYSTTWPGQHTSTYTVPFDKQVVENCKVIYTVPMRAWGNDDAHPGTIRLYVNGVVKLSVCSTDLV